VGSPARFLRHPLSTSQATTRGGPPGPYIHRLRPILGWWQVHPKWGCNAFSHEIAGSWQLSDQNA
jgi:hypothetical protein